MATGAAAVPTVVPEEQNKDSQQSKKDEEAALASRLSQVNAIATHMGLNVFSLTVVLTQRVILLREVTGLKPQDAAALLASISSGVGAVEFGLNPIAGKASDAYGRLPFLLQSPTMSMILKSATFLYPSSTTIALERAVGGACTTIGGSTNCNNAISDLISDPEERAMAFQKLGYATGLGLMMGPMVGTWAAGVAGSPRGAFGIGAVASMLQLGLSSARLTETLTEEKRKPMPAGGDLLKALNPLSFLELYKNGATMAKLVTGAALQFFTEGKAVSDLNGYYLLNETDLDDNQRAWYFSIWGLVMTLAGKISPHTTKWLGMRNFTTSQNIATALGLGLTGLTTIPAVIFAALPIHMFAMERGSCVRSLALSSAKEAGMGIGEFSGKLANLRAVANSLAPLLYAKVYAIGIQRKMPGLAFIAGACIVMLAEFILRSVPRMKCEDEHDKKMQEERDKKNAQK